MTTASRIQNSIPAQSKLKLFLVKNHLPIGLGVFTALGLLWPDPGVALGKTPINVISIAAIFFITGLHLQTAEVINALRKS